MSALGGTRKFLHWTLAVLLLVQGWPFVAWAIPANGTRVENVRFEKSGELVYMGLLRTRLDALLPEVRIRGDRVPLSPEFFAIIADAHLVLGRIER